MSDAQRLSRAYLAKQQVLALQNARPFHFPRNLDVIDLGLTGPEIERFQNVLVGIERRFDAVIARRAGRVPPHHNPPANTPGDHPIPTHPNEDNHVRRGGTD